ncbi:Membrane protein of unknown function [Magnetospirillum gryphiswaldense MSR-1 v2]|uniref:Uncharacterized protein n=1 Tax=Magnetospirillum gryphiswaldense (strain DSM 6361 / JCM 21280 / NBRC 15271 / MSR-1) TaxID=431944 RepID=V6F3T5_MAGGM|nr:hypothetical protein [Magnetospirillum gryphiswaldense]CDK98941.1 Membrane protein of unknown function [Magnetospirillum gryphiswaldense MSR-1 v2]
MQKVLKGLKFAGWVVIIGGMLISAVRVFLTLKAQAFDQVAGAGVYALVGLAGGGLTVALARFLEDLRANRALACRVVGDALPSHPVSALGLLVVLAGLAYIATVVWTFVLGDDRTLAAWSVVAAGPGLLMVLGGIVLMLIGGVVKSPRRGR